MLFCHVLKLSWLCSINLLHYFKNCKISSMATRLFVGNLPENIEENSLKSAFSEFGEITNLDLKSKSSVDTVSKTFAFVTLSASNFNIESCIKFFSNNDFHGKRLYVTRARESFLEKLQRERAEAQQKQVEKEQQEPPKNVPIMKLSENLKPRKRKFENETNHADTPLPMRKTTNLQQEQFGKNNLYDSEKSKTYEHQKSGTEVQKKKMYVEKEDNFVKNKVNVDIPDKPELGHKKLESEKKRIEAMKKKREDFKTKQMIVKTGLTAVDKVQNKKVIFSDNEEDVPSNHTINGVKSKQTPKKNLFDGINYEDDDEVNFEIKKQFEGKKGQKVLDLQSRYKSDKRFVLDERFIDNEQSEGGKGDEMAEEEDKIDINQSDEKEKQLDILQDVLGVAIKRKMPEEGQDNRKTKPKMGMLRFDPMQPQHAKFLAPVEDTKQQSTKKSKKKKDKQIEEPQIEEVKSEEPRPEVSKETFYKVSETLKEAIAQPTSFSLRSLFGNKEDQEESKTEDYTPLPQEKKRAKVKNPLDPGEKNPFKYDSSDSEPEEEEKVVPTEPAPLPTEIKAVWKETLFFGPSDQRLKEGLAFFNNITELEPQKERRELKSLMKKRIYNKERKNQMFQKKIGGRKKTMKQSFKRKS